MADVIDDGVSDCEEEPEYDVDDCEDIEVEPLRVLPEMHHGCEHYQRKCLLLAPCCRKVYSCRICHNEQEDHELDRKQVEQVVCAIETCQTTQIVQSNCEKCNIVFGSYFCAVCRLYDDVDKKQFHCDGCGICRIGGRENYFHCDKCDVCLHNNLKDKHKCVEKASRNNCPVCMEDLHTSREECTVLNCGHLLHRVCMRDMLKTSNFACALCGQCMVNMENVWEILDKEIEDTPMPDEYQNLFVQILCKDCHKESRVKFHIVGLKCSPCGSYNTCRSAEPSYSDEAHVEHSDENPHEAPTESQEPSLDDRQDNS